MNGVFSVGMKTASAFFRYFWMFPVFIIGSTPVPSLLFGRLTRADGVGAEFLRAVLVAVSLALCFLMLVGESYNPFLYFRF
jgi:hypothetical protein